MTSSTNRASLIERLEAPDAWIRVSSEGVENIDGAPVEAAALIRELVEASSHLADEMDGLLPYLASHNWRLDRLQDAVSKVRQATLRAKASHDGGQQ